MAGFTSDTNDAVMLKVVVDYAYFLKLKELEAEKELETEKELKTFSENSKSKSNLNSSPKSTATDQYGAGDLDTTTMENDQIGEGHSKSKHSNQKHQQHPKHSSESLNEEKLRRIFREEIHRYFSKPPTNFIDHVKNIKVKDVLQHIPYVNQLIGRGYVDEDLAPNAIESHDNTSMHNNNEGGYYSQLGQSKPIILHQNDFLKLIPTKFHSRAKKLLNYFENHSMNVSWNADGNITVASEFIPNSNIYAIFTELYKLKPDLKLPGYITLTSYLLNAGLGHLFLKGRYWFTNRSKRFNYKGAPFEDQTGHGQKKWYFIGD